MAAPGAGNCPSWCQQEHGTGGGAHGYEHAARVGSTAQRRGVEPLVDPEVFVYLEQAVDDEGTVYAPQVQVKECWCDTPADARELAGDCLRRPTRSRRR